MAKTCRNTNRISCRAKWSYDNCEESSNPRFIALDMLAQSEHDPLASSYLLTNSRKLAEKVKGEIEKELMVLPRKKYSWRVFKRGGIFVISSIDEAIDLSNEFALNILR